MSTISANPSGTNLSRYVKALAVGKGSLVAAAGYAEEQWRDSPAVHLTLKAAVDPMTSGNSSALSSYGIQREVLELLRTTSVVERLKTRMFPAPFGAAVPVESASPIAGWVGQTDGIPVSDMTFGSVTMDPFTKLGVIVAITRELVRASGPNAEAAVRRIIINAVGFAQDREFLTSGVTAVADLRPGSITNGLAATTSTGSSSSAIATDLSTMTATLTTWRDVVWLMQPKTFSYICAHNDGNILQFVNGQPLLLGFPVFLSLGTPQQITLVDLGGIAIADDGSMEISVSNEVTAEMSTTPIAGDTSPFTGAVLKSFWQNNLIGIKILRYISWKRTANGNVAYMPVTY